MTPKYEPIEEERRIAICLTEPEHYVLHLYEANQLSGGPRLYTDPVAASRATAKFAIAIADRVHGAELEDLRVQCEKNSTALSHVYALRYALVAEIKYYREQEGHPDHGFTSEVMQAFNKASTFLSLPVTNGSGVPMELHPAEPNEPFQPTMEHCSRMSDWNYLVKWGPGPEQCAYHMNCDEAAVDFGERYAAWKAATQP